MECGPIPYVTEESLNDKRSRLWGHSCSIFSDGGGGARCHNQLRVNILVEESPEEDVKEQDLKASDAVTTVSSQYNTGSLNEIDESCPKDMNDDKDTQEIVPGSSIDKVVVQEDGKASNVDEEKITIDQKVAPINENENDPVYVQCKEIILSSSPKI